MADDTAPPAPATEATYADVRRVLAVLAEHRIKPASMHVDWAHTADEPTYVNVWVRYRTEVEAVAASLGRKVRRRTVVTGQRHYSTEDTGPLVQAMSFPHHHDWEPTLDRGQP